MFNHSLIKMFYNYFVEIIEHLTVTKITKMIQSLVLIFSEFTLKSN